MISGSESGVQVEFSEDIKGRESVVSNAEQRPDEQSQQSKGAQLEVLTDDEKEKCNRREAEIKETRHTGKGNQTATSRKETITHREAEPREIKNELRA